MDLIRLDFRYKEALRQRASKAKLLSELLMAPYKKEDQQKNTNTLLTRMLFPHGMKESKQTQENIDHSWNSLRDRQK